MVDSVVVLIAYILYVRPGNSEGNTPVATHAHSPKALSVTFQRVQVEAGQGHVAWLGRHIETSQDQSQLTGMFRLDPGRDSTPEEPLQAVVSEAEYGHPSIVTRNVSGYKYPGFGNRAAAKS
jgi:hypothetical protein